MFFANDAGELLLAYCAAVSKQKCHLFLPAWPNYGEGVWLLNGPSGCDCMALLWECCYCFSDLELLHHRLHVADLCVQSCLMDMETVWSPDRLVCLDTVWGWHWSATGNVGCNNGATLNLPHSLYLFVSLCVSVLSIYIDICLLLYIWIAYVLHSLCYCEWMN